jgi:hypothetical protein
MVLRAGSGSTNNLGSIVIPDVGTVFPAMANRSGVDRAAGPTTGIVPRRAAMTEYRATCSRMIGAGVATRY